AAGLAAGQQQRRGGPGPAAQGRGADGRASPLRRAASPLAPAGDAAAGADHPARRRTGRRAAAGTACCRAGARRMRRQRGVALITVLLVVALATLVCAGLMLRQQLAIRSVGNQLLVRQAQYYAEGGELLARALLLRDLREAGQLMVDHPGEAWASPGLRFPLDEGGELRLRIEDLAGRFNLNSLAAAGEAGELALLRLRRLLQHLG